MPLAYPFHLSPAAPELLDAVGLLGELAADPEAWADIPRVLVTVLPLDRVAFAIVRQTDPRADRLLVSAGCQAGDDPLAEPLACPGIPEERAAALGAPDPAAGEDGGAAALGRLESSPAGHMRRSVEWVRQLDDRHRMILILHWGRRLAARSDEPADLARLLCDALARALRPLFAWRDQPALLGGGFAHISGAQGRVLCQLGSDLSEKELAAALHMAPHTLHSHIKKIYQKLGVCSRLEAARRLRQAVRRYRAACRRWTAPGPAPACADEAAVPAVCSLSGGAIRRLSLTGKIGVARDCLRRLAAARP